VLDDDEDGTAEGDDGSFGALLSGDASVVFAEEGGGSAGGDGCLAQDSGQVGVAVAGAGAAFVLSGRFPDTGGEACPGRRVRGWGSGSCLDRFRR
jgi:hypothetical protein